MVSQRVFSPPQIYAGPNGAVIAEHGSDYAMYFTRLIVKSVTVSHEFCGTISADINLESCGEFRRMPVEDAMAEVDSLAGASIQELLAVIYQRLENSTNT